MIDGRPHRRRLTIFVWAAAFTAYAPLATAQSSGPSLIDVVRHAERGSSRAAVEERLSAGADVNEAEPDGTTALHWAIQVDDQDVAQTLLEAGAAVDATNRYGVTPLALAATNGSAPLVNTLLQAGARPDTPSPGGDTPLMLAARTGRLEVLRLLLDAGADVGATEQWKGQTALMWAAAEGHGDIVTALVAAGAWVETRSWSDRSPLLFAVREGHTSSVQALLAAGADVKRARGRRHESAGSGRHQCPLRTGRAAPGCRRRPERRRPPRLDAARPRLDATTWGRAPPYPHRLAR